MLSLGLRDFLDVQKLLHLIVVEKLQARLVIDELVDLERKIHSLRQPCIQVILIGGLDHALDRILDVFIVYESFRLHD